jgi:hypothetical protein
MTVAAVLVSDASPTRETMTPGVPGNALTALIRQLAIRDIVLT